LHRPLDGQQIRLPWALKPQSVSVSSHLPWNGPSPAGSATALLAVLEKDERSCEHPIELAIARTARHLQRVFINSYLTPLVLGGHAKGGPTICVRITSRWLVRADCSVAKADRWGGHNEDSHPNRSGAKYLFYLKRSECLRQATTALSQYDSGAV
jgi:hypothetical protein